MPMVQVMARLLFGGKKAAARCAIALFEFGDEFGSIAYAAIAGSYDF